MNIDKIEIFQDKVRDFIISEAEKTGLNLVHWDSMLLFHLENGAYAATSCKTKPLSDFWEDCKPTDMFSMYDLTTAMQNQYKHPTLQLILNLIGRKLEEMEPEVGTKMLEVMKQITDDSAWEGKLLQLNSII